MNRHTLLQTNTTNLNQLFSNGINYKVPLYQRDYAWREENWADLWHDIVEITKNEQPHYMGAIVLQRENDKSYQIIDGQQRLATLSLIALAIIKHLRELVEQGVEPDNNRERIDILMNKYIGGKSAGSLLYTSKLFLNENNNTLYQTYLVQARRPLNESRLNDSEKLIWKAFRFFYDQIRVHLQEQHRFHGQGLSDFLESYVADRLFFIVITVDDEVNAYTVFETLNARGTQLTVTDLLKNYLFSVAGGVKSDLAHIKNQWNQIIAIIDLERFPTFLRHFWNARQPLVRQDRLFKTIRNHYCTADDVFNLLDHLEKSANLYAAFTNPHDEFWQGNRILQNYMRELKLFRMTQCFPLLMAAYECFAPAEFERVVRICVVISFRYSIVGERNPNVMEEQYNRTAQLVFKGQLTTPQQLLSELKEIYLTDDLFRSNFASRQFNSRRHKQLLRYILFAIENQEANNKQDYEADPATLEHILPENPGRDWATLFPDELHENFVYRLGNYTLLEANKNRECQNKGYTNKLAIYQESRYKITHSIQADEWTPAQINNRQNRFANLATAIWRIE